MRYFALRTMTGTARITYEFWQWNWNSFFFRFTFFKRKTNWNNLIFEYTCMQINCDLQKLNCTICTICPINIYDETICEKKSHAQIYARLGHVFVLWKPKRWKKKPFIIYSFIIFLILLWLEALRLCESMSQEFINSKLMNTKHTSLPFLNDSRFVDSFIPKKW